MPGIGDWFKSLPPEQQYALGGSLIGGGALGAMGMMHADRGKKLKGALSGLAMGGLGGAAAGYGIHKMMPAVPPPVPGVFGQMAASAKRQAAESGKIPNLPKVVAGTPDTPNDGEGKPNGVTLDQVVHGGKTIGFNGLSGAATGAMAAPAAAAVVRGLAPVASNAAHSAFDRAMFARHGAGGTPTPYTPSPGLGARMSPRATSGDMARAAFRPALAGRGNLLSFLTRAPVIGATLGGAAGTGTGIKQVRTEQPQ